MHIVWALVQCLALATRAKHLNIILLFIWKYDHRRTRNASNFKTVVAVCVCVFASIPISVIEYATEWNGLNGGYGRMLMNMNSRTRRKTCNQPSWLNYILHKIIVDVEP